MLLRPKLSAVQLSELVSSLRRVGPRSLSSLPSCKGYVLGIETSADDTGVAIVDSKGNVLGEGHHSQIANHRGYGGIFPQVAGKLHRQNLTAVYKQALSSAGLTIEDVDAIAFTVGPGLSPCLAAGRDFAVQLASDSRKPLMPVNHMHAHALTARLMEGTQIQFPFLVLLASGGHCTFAVVHSVNDFSVLGSKRDDAPGEAFDKVARYLHLHRSPNFAHLSGGAAIEMAAKQGDPHWPDLQLKEPLLKWRDCSTSFCGLKCFVRDHIGEEVVSNREEKEGPVKDFQHYAAVFQRVTLSHITRRALRAIGFCQRHFPAVKQLVVSGGVACNGELRNCLRSATGAAAEGWGVFFPPAKLCSDNGVMIAWAGVEYLRAGVPNLVGDLCDVRYKPNLPIGKDISSSVIEANVRVRLGCDGSVEIIWPSTKKFNASR